MARMAMIDMKWMLEFAYHLLHETWIIIRVSVRYLSLAYIGHGLEF
jgi:hypothetical protein